jgi:regulation of enolase protein 1 (concanavalin A-like superfamily)
MNRIVRALLLTLGACSALTVAGCGLKQGPFETGWDKPVDPDGDCAFLRDMSGLTIEVPGRHHDLAVEHGLMNAPRLLRDVQGDFTAQATVSGSFRPSVGSTSGQNVPFLGAGLVVMDGDKTYARLERAAMYKGGQVVSSVLWELRINGQVASSPWPGFTPQEDKVLYLRLQRQGDRLLASVSQDGNTWTPAQPLSVKLPAQVKIGVAACSTSESQFKPHFDDFRLTPGG